MPAIGAEERLLDDVTGLLFAPDDAVREGIDRPLPSQDELIEALRVAAHRQRDEFFVGSRHSGWPAGPRDTRVGGWEHPTRHTG